MEIQKDLLKFNKFMQQKEQFEVEDTINNRVDLMFLHASPLVFKDFNVFTKKEGF